MISKVFPQGFQQLNGKTSSINIRFVIPGLTPPVDYSHIYWRNALNAASAALGGNICVEAPAYAQCEALDNAHPFPVYRSGFWRKIQQGSDAATNSITDKIKWKALAFRKVSQWKTANEGLIVFAGLRDNTAFLNRVAGRLPYAIFLQDNEVDEMIGDLKKLSSTMKGILGRAKFIAAFHPKVKDAVAKINCQNTATHHLPLFVDLAFFKPNVQTEGVERRFQLNRRGAVFTWIPSGRIDELAPLISCWIERDEEWQKSTSLIVGFKNDADAKRLQEWLKDKFQLEKLPSWLRSADKVPFNHLPYYFNAAGLFIHIEPSAKRCAIKGWEIAAAAACGCPVVTLNNEPWASYAQSPFGFRIDSYTPASLNRLLDEQKNVLDLKSDAAKNLRTACRAAAEQYFNSDRFKVALAAIFS